MFMRSSVLSVSIVAAMALSACDATPSTKTTVTTTTEGPSAPAATPQAAPLTPSGAATPLTIAESSQTDDGLQWAAGVVKVDDVSEGAAKLFGVAGGDPAMNGLQTYIAFFQNPADGWAVYQIGDFLDYTVLHQADGRVDLDIHESTMDEASGDIGDRHRKIIVQWTSGGPDTAPASVTVTPGQ